MKLTSTIDLPYDGAARNLSKTPLIYVLIATSSSREGKIPVLLHSADPPLKEAVAAGRYIFELLPCLVHLLSSS
eukprot:scaffold13772_cov154-Skeletonema_dohrnii-CCMP3373.AAC.4